MKALTTRREALLAAGAAALLAGCGDDDRPRVLAFPADTLAIDYASYYAPVNDLTRQLLAAARHWGLTATLTADQAGAAAQLASVRALTGPRGGFGFVAIAPFDAAALRPVITAARRRGIRVAGFVSPLPGADLQVGPDPADAARHLFAHAPLGPVLLVLPPATSPVPDPFFGYATAAARALRASFAGRVGTTVTAFGADDAALAIRAALRREPKLTTVLTWNDTTALGALRAVPRDGFVGAVGTPVPTSRHVLRALDADNPFKVLAATRPQTLAQDLMLARISARAWGARLSGREATRLTAFTPGSPELRAALRDYAA